AFLSALQEYPRERVPLEWAGTQYNLGLTLTELGQRESGMERLEAAIAAYGLLWRNAPALVCRLIGRRRKLVSATHSRRSGSERAGRLGYWRPAPPSAGRWKNTPDIAYRSTGRWSRTTWATRL